MCHYINIFFNRYDFVQRKKISTKFNLKSYLILVLLATVCDVMPLRGLNRIIAINVLNNISIYHVFKL